MDNLELIIDEYDACISRAERVARAAQTERAMLEREFPKFCASIVEPAFREAERMMTAKGHATVISPTRGYRANVQHSDDPNIAIQFNPRPTSGVAFRSRTLMVEVEADRSAGLIRVYTHIGGPKQEIGSGFAMSCTTAEDVSGWIVSALRRWLAVVQ
jgi:hypothetical protein